MLGGVVRMMFGLDLYSVFRPVQWVSTEVFVSTDNNRKSLHDTTASSGLGCCYLKDCFYCTPIFLQQLTANLPNVSLVHGKEESGMRQLPALSAFPLGLQCQHSLVPALLALMHIILILFFLWYPGLGLASGVADLVSN